MSDQIEMNEPVERGAPSKFQEEYCEELIAHMSEGLSFESFGAVAHCCTKTLYNWCKEYPSFLHAKNVGTAYSAIFWEKMGVGGARGDMEKFNAAAWIFNMKNRFKWADRTETEISGSAEPEKKLVIQFTKESKNGNEENL